MEVTSFSLTRVCHHDSGRADCADGRGGRAVCGRAGRSQVYGVGVQSAAQCHLDPRWNNLAFNQALGQYQSSTSPLFIFLMSVPHSLPLSTGTCSAQLSVS